MTDDLQELGRRAVACRAWRWTDGMRALDGDRRCGYRLTENSGLPGHPDPVVDDSWLPDLSDAATLGCLLALVREAWGDPTLCVIYDHDDREWYIGRWEDGGIALRSFGPTEREALVAALEAAPVQP